MVKERKSNVPFSIDSSTEKLLFEIGEGNRSQGLRTVVDHWKKTKPGKHSKPHRVVDESADDSADEDFLA